MKPICACIEKRNVFAHAGWVIFGSGRVLWCQQCGGVISEQDYQRQISAMMDDAQESAARWEAMAI